MSFISLIHKISIKNFIGCLLFFYVGISSLNAQSYCIPTVSTCSRMSRIDSVSFGAIKNASGCGVNGYSDYTKTVNPATISAGTYVPIFIKPGSRSSYIRMAIDFNQNGLFEPGEITDFGNEGLSEFGSVRIPFTSLPGNTRMRIIVDGIASQMCNNYGVGETEDYLVTILPSKTPGPHFTFYVNQSGPGTSDGLSWDNAFQDISDAMGRAKGRDTIKVAEGYYIQKFNLIINDSIILKGGYPNTGNPSDKERNFAKYQTVITGKNGNSGNPFEDRHLPVIFKARDYESTKNRNFIIDGFIIENAYENALSVQNISSAEIRNCVFRKNYSYNDGAVINSINSKLKIVNCFFDENNYESSKNTIHLLENSSVDFINCNFSNNKAENAIVFSERSKSSFINCSFVHNAAYSRMIFAEDNSTINIENSIFYNNFIDSSELKLNTSLVNITNTITQNYNYGNAVFLSMDPKFKDVNNIKGPDNLYFTDDDGLQLLNPCSPAINIGLNDAIINLDNDIMGNPRIFGNQVDLGAYEVQSEILAIPGSLYVNKLATGTNDGSSWANAFTDLQRAMHFCSDTIRIAAGSYTPSDFDQNASFVLQNNRVILGGYPNTGKPGDLERDPAKFPTILSGNLSNGMKSKIIMRGSNVNNTATVDGVRIMDANSLYTISGAVYLVANSSPNFINCVFKNNGHVGLMINNSSPKIENSTFENSKILNSNSSQSHFINCTFKGDLNTIGSESRASGGAVLNSDSDPVFDSCTFLQNVSNNGGAMANINSNPVINNSKFLSNAVYAYADFGGYGNDLYNDNSNPQIFNTNFKDGTGALYGGSIANINNSTPIFTKCEFQNGSARNNGGVCYNDNSTPQFINCVFANTNGGGTFHNLNESSPKLVNCIAYGNSGSFMFNDNSHPEIKNSTIVNNGGDVFINNGSSKLSLYNCILWGNIAGKEFTGYSTIPVVIKNSITQVYGTNGVDGNMVGINPRLIDITNPAGPDGLFFTSDDGVNLINCSPAINKGLNSAIIGTTKDVLGNLRIYNTTVDIGAYEYQSMDISQAKTYFVNASAIGSNDGSSWGNAFKALQTAIQNSCADTVKVAMGIYKPATNTRDSSFYINRGITILGGYPNIGDPADSVRNADKYPTILSGDIGRAGDSTDNSYSIMKINCGDTTVFIQGLTFKNANGITALNAMANKNSVISNCRFYNNSSQNGGAIIANDNVLIEKSVFSFNNADWGGALNVQGSNVAVKNSVFSNNTGYMGGAVYCSSNAIFENTLFYKNNTTWKGAGVYIEGNQYAKFINCNFVTNNVIKTGIGTGTDLFFSYSGSHFSNPIIVNCIFKDNMFNGGKNTNKYTDWAWVKDGNSASDYMLNIQNSAAHTLVTYYENNISADAVSFRNIEDAIGPDGIWFTEDDGLMPDACSYTKDKGSNSAVENIPTDILQNARIHNGMVDIGAYEFSDKLNPLVTIVASDSTICEGGSVVFKATPISGGDHPSYQWVINNVKADSDSSVFVGNNLKNGDVVKCILTSDSKCVSDTSAISNIITISTSENIMPTVTISNADTAICQNATTSFTTKATGSGIDPMYQWQINNVNAGANSPNFKTNALRKNDEVKVIMTSSYSCALPKETISNSLSIRVNDLPIAQAGKDTLVCAGTPVKLQGTGGKYYHWRSLTGAGLSDYNIADPITNPDTTSVFELTVSNDGICIAKDSITLYVNQWINSSVSIHSSKNNLCAGESMSFSAVAINGGTSPHYQWQVNAVNVGSNTPQFVSSKLKNNDFVRAILTSSIFCAIPATSNEIEVALVTLDPPIIDLNNRVLTITNPDNNVIYTWQVLNGSQWVDVSPASNSVNYSIVNDGSYRVKVTKFECVLFSNEITSKPLTANQPGIFLYPNPTKGNLTIDSLFGKWQTLEVLNFQGMRMMPPKDIRNENSVFLQFENLPAGFYIIKIVGINGEKKQLKFIKE